MKSLFILFTGVILTIIIGSIGLPIQAGKQVVEKVVYVDKIVYVEKNVTVPEEIRYIPMLMISETELYYVKVGGSASWRNNNPFNITCMSGLHSGAINIAHSSAGDEGDKRMCVFETMDDGGKAFDNLVMRRYNKKSIKIAFKAYQTSDIGFKQKLAALRKAKININKKYGQLTYEQQKTFKKIWRHFEGYKVGEIQVASHGAPELTTKEDILEKENSELEVMQ